MFCFYHHSGVFVSYDHTVLKEVTPGMIFLYQVASIKMKFSINLIGSHNTK